jgi:hypothetical protein
VLHAVPEHGPIAELKRDRLIAEHVESRKRAGGGGG